MPADRSLADDLADDLTGLYRDLRHTLIVALAARLRRSLAGRDNPHGIAARLLRTLDARLDERVRRSIEAATRRGQDAADAELARLRRPPLPPSQVEVAGRVYELAQALRATHPQAVRWAERAYRETVLAAELAEGGTRLQIAQRAWSRLVGRGVTGFTDTAGRRWELASYVEMATRSRLADAAVTAHLDRLGDAGLDLVVVSDAPGECAVCRPWEGKILTRTGLGARAVQVEHATQDRMVTVRVAGSVREAKAAGLMHPGCRHSISAYLPGVTRPATRTADPQGDAARQRLRELERQVRAWKLRAEAALDPAEGRRCAANARDRQRVLREHLAAYPSLRRQPQRERTGVAR